MEGWIGQAVQFLREVVVEMKKVSWSSRQQVVGSTVVIVGLVLMLSLYVGAVDWVLSKTLRLFLQ